MSSLDLVAGKLGLVEKNNDNYKGFDGIFTDDVRLKEDIELSCEIPNTIVEDGNVVNDHVIFNPQVITIEGEVGEVYIKDNSTLTQYFRANSSLGVISQYLPSRTATQLSRINKVINDGLNITRTIDKAINDFKYIKGTFNRNSPSVQDKFLEYIEGIYSKGELIKIDTSLGFYDNMKLISFVASKTDENYMTYKMTFQKWRTAQTILTTLDGVAKNAIGDASTQTAKTSDKGLVQGKSTSQNQTQNQSLLLKIGSLF